MPDDSVEGIGLQMILPDGTLATAGDTSALNELPTFTATYDGGDLRLHLDGVQVASATTSGEVDLGGFPLFIGEDVEGPVHENFIGTMDDVLVLGQALTPAEVLQLHQEGAQAVLPDPTLGSLLAIGAAWLASLGRGRRLSRDLCRDCRVMERSAG